MLANNGLRLNYRQGVHNARCNPIEAGKINRSSLLKAAVSAIFFVKLRAGGPMTAQQ
jgi:hypothetical protein